VDFFDLEILFGLSVRDILDYTLLAIILAGIVYALFFRPKSELD
jgi:hypothetical protein